MLCRIGAVEIWRILDINAPFLTPAQMFPNAGPDVADIMAGLVPHGLCPETGRVILPVQGFLLKTPDHVVLVDTCVGNHKTNGAFPEWHMRDDARFMASLTAAGITPEDVDYVLCTHLHVDHVGWNTQLLDGRWVPSFPNARYLMPREDEAEMVDKSKAMYGQSILPVIEAGQAEFVEGTHALGDHITLVPTPGHTPGHVSVQIADGDAKALITGDCIHSAAQCWHPEWHFQFDDDAPLAESSRRALLGQAAEDNARVLGTHFRLPSLGRVREKGDAFEWSEDA